MLILTLFDRAMMECGIVCVRSIERYLSTYPEFHFAVDAIPENYGRHPSWHKVESLQKHLPDHDFVLCLDADSLIIGKQNLRTILKDCTLNIAEDENGANNGIAAWKNCDESFDVLERMHRSHDRQRGKPWFEQHTLHELIDTMDVHYQDKKVFNAYPSDRDATTQILHYPGMTPRDRLPLMQRELNRLKR